MDTLPWPLALERYTQLVPQEVIRVAIEVDGDPDVVVIFKGFSSSLMKATSANPDEPVIAPTARFVSLDRLQGPLDPVNPVVLQADLNWEQVVGLLKSAGILVA